MNDHEYTLLIWFATSVAWAMVWLPCVLYLSVAWRIRRKPVGKPDPRNAHVHGLFAVFSPKEIKSYYELFRPTVAKDISELGPEELERTFETSFTRIYGRRRYVLPLLLLAFVAAIGLWGTAKSLESMQALSSLKFPPIAVSAFLGAWTWVVYDQFSRLRNRDLTFHDVYGCVFRFLIAVPFGFFLGKWAGDYGISVAFLLGTFPTGTLFKIGRRLAVQQLKLGEDAEKTSKELEKLQCVSRSSAERFMDEGINTIAELAWCDPVDLTLRTNKEFDYVIDCASQALVWVYFEEKTRELYKLSLRTAHEVTSLVYGLDLGDGDKKSRAEETLVEGAKVLGMEPKALENTLRLIEDDPFVKFLVAVWHWPPPPPSKNPVQRE